MLNKVTNDIVRFSTARPPGSPFATLERRVVVTGPEELVELARTPDISVLEQLVEMLKEPERAWAAVIVLAAMTRREEKIVDNFSRSPSEWNDSLGKGAHERWARWFNEARDRLRWDAEQQAFLEKS